MDQVLAGSATAIRPLVDAFQYRTLALFIITLCSAGGVAASEVSWAPPPPEPDEFDWIQLTSGEWLKGEFVVFYSEKLEFNSEELDLRIFDWDDIQILRSGGVVQMRLLSGERLYGQLLVEGDVVKLSGSAQEYHRDQILTITAGEPKERNFWNANLSLGANWLSGNTDQAEANARLRIARRTLSSRLVANYLGNYSVTRDVVTVNNHRASLVGDYFIDERLFVRPIIGEYYRDPFQNIGYRLTVGAGVGYEVIDTARTEWVFTAAPGFQYTRFEEVRAGEPESASTPALLLDTRLDMELTRSLDLSYDYQVQFTNQASGLYSHHMVAGVKVELSTWLDLDVSLVWDRLQEPTEDALGNVPEQDDWRFVLGLGFNF